MVVLLRVLGCSGTWTGRGGVSSGGSVSDEVMLNASDCRSESPDSKKTVSLDLVSSFSGDNV